MQRPRAGERNRRVEPPLDRGRAVRDAAAGVEYQRSVLAVLQESLERSLTSSHLHSPALPGPADAPVTRVAESRALAAKRLGLVSRPLAVSPDAQTANAHDDARISVVRGSASERVPQRGEPSKESIASRPSLRHRHFCHPRHPRWVSADDSMNG